MLTGLPTEDEQCWLGPFVQLIGHGVCQKPEIALGPFQGVPEARRGLHGEAQGTQVVDIDGLGIRKGQTNTIGMGVSNPGGQVEVIGIREPAIDAFKLAHALIAVEQTSVLGQSQPGCARQGPRKYCCNGSHAVPDMDWYAKN